MRHTVLAAAAALVLAACAAPRPSPFPPDPGRVGAGPTCGPQQYPFQALQDFQRGQAIVRAQVGPDSRLVNPVLEEAPMNQYLAAGALDAVRQCSLPQARPGSDVRLLVAYDFHGQNEYLPNGVVTVLFAPLPAR
ncbi:hypothetical protein H8N03_01420 [Ramlibacter sp. USB13]|uniref:Lipoprotein n=1 Tax=Ramlibacter cellulosilyticus TaxID=2764187 RepID=A0A923MPQ3_9BURK|nr:hypothetical protein [Ramlibacter cellulosilyticus]MBC5781582.1 hypothetical protein [Ramlibacter cellulosilyticus]